MRYTNIYYMQDAGAYILPVCTYYIMTMKAHYIHYLYIL